MKRQAAQGVGRCPTLLPRANGMSGIEDGNRNGALRNQGVAESVFVRVDITVERFRSW
jgi:hypothetical protein